MTNVLRESQRSFQFSRMKLSRFYLEVWGSQVPNDFVRSFSENLHSSKYLAFAISRIVISELKGVNDPKLTIVLYSLVMPAN